MINESRPPAILERDLNNFDPAVRREALAALLALPDIDVHPEVQAVNMHAHTFFSFNAYGHSPTSLVWLAKTHGFKAIGTVDFDVLDAVDEFLTACDLTGIRGSCALETRVYVPEYATREINSPGEPGVAYYMGIGFATGKVNGVAARIINDLRARAAQRNRELVARVNVYLRPIEIDYDRDVLPLTPNGNATERHILVAYTAAVAARKVDAVAFWAEKLGVTREQMALDIQDTPRLHNLIRSKLMKRGGVGYVQPGPATFPSIDEFHEFVLACGALPCATWLDGTSTGEQMIEELLSLFISKGVVALTSSQTGTGTSRMPCKNR
jgi:hypothetical protein